MFNKLQVINATKPIRYNKFKVKVAKKDSIKTAKYSLKLRVNSNSTMNSYSNKYDYEILKYNEFNTAKEHIQNFEFINEDILESIERTRFSKDHENHHTIMGDYEGKEVTLENCIYLSNMKNVSEGGLTYLLQMVFPLQIGKFYDKICIINQNILSNLGFEEMIVSNSSDDFSFDENTGILSGFINSTREFRITLRFKYNLAYGIIIRPRLSHDLI